MAPWTLAAGTPPGIASGRPLRRLGNADPCGTRALRQANRRRFMPPVRVTPVSTPGIPLTPPHYDRCNHRSGSQAQDDHDDQPNGHAALVFRRHRRYRSGCGRRRRRRRRRRHRRGRRFRRRCCRRYRRRCWRRCRPRGRCRRRHRSRRRRGLRCRRCRRWWYRRRRRRGWWYRCRRCRRWWYRCRRCRRWWYRRRRRNNHGRRPPSTAAASTTAASAATAGAGSPHGNPGSASDGVVVAVVIPERAGEGVRAQRARGGRCR